MNDIGHASEVDQILRRFCKNDVSKRRDNNCIRDIHGIQVVKIV